MDIAEREAFGFISSADFPEESEKTTFWRKGGVLSLAKGSYTCFPASRIKRLSWQEKRQQRHFVQLGVILLVHIGKDSS
uniref:Uncharacterized protein n=1 Tax=Candidatus Kentrum sp. SD TaxID=2126332 RepID=A0A450YJ32_9GAMM|nr:MAG: hypothetical protein BECKSD772F_GA0070984_101230 [Candidatus Kentron sp. SD]VFK41521.1 MAG: hypothetical protein BECKSD772E_GA0070983_101229 [Candidatus Kentron sp. SD]